MYYYAGNNPIKYIDPDGRIVFMFGIYGNAGIGPLTKTAKDKLKSVTVADSGTFGIPGDTPAEGHIYDNYSVSILEFKIDENKVEDVKKDIEQFQNNEDYEGMEVYI